jgi:hypothetical protein
MADPRNTHLKSFLVERFGGFPQSYRGKAKLLKASRINDAEK